MNYKHYLDSCNHVGTFYNKHYLDQWLSEYNGFFNGRPLSSDFIEAMAVLKDDIYASISKEYWPHITDRLLSCALNESGKYSHDAIVVFTVVSVEANFLGVNKSYSAQQKVKAAHGGKREGAGRKKEALTKQIRIDADLAQQFKTISDLYRSESESDKAYFRLMLDSFIEKFLREKADEDVTDAILEVLEQDL